MKPSKTGRVFATLFLGLMFGIYRHFDEMRWIGRGRESFLAEQNLHFDKITRYHPTGTMLIAGVILAVVVVGLYELVAAGIDRVLPQNTVEE